MKFRVCILAAGKGSRNSFSENYHKALIPINGKSIISHIIDCYPNNTKFVIAVGYNSNLVKNFLKITHPNKKFIFVKVKDYTGKKSGPGKSLLKCKKYLQTPFISHACDALIKYKIKKFKNNWLGYDYLQNKEVLKFVSITKKNVFVDFSRTKNYGKVFIGVAGIYDYKKFWNKLQSKNNFSLKLSKTDNYEKQMLDGFHELNNIKLKKIKWFDTGDDHTYVQSLLKMSATKNIVMPKRNEFLYFENKKVIKYFKETEIGKLRYQRSKYLGKFGPKNVKFENNFLYYDFFPGKTLTHCKSGKLFKNFLNRMIKSFWKKKKLSRSQRKKFETECYQFYKVKTNKRVKKFLKLFPSSKKINVINNYKIISVEKLLKKIDWNYLKRGTATNIHGDTAPNNVIINNKKSFFILIDWREKFNNLIKYGDIYYDFAKIYHALEVSQLLEIDKLYTVIQKKNKIIFKHKSYKNLISFKKIFIQIIKSNEFDLKKIILLSNLIFLNIAPLHQGDFGRLFFWKGIYNLNKLINAK